MKCWLGAIALLYACTYDLPIAPGDDPDDPADPDPSGIEAACFAAADPLLCLEFERPDGMTAGLALDGSGNGLDAVSESVQNSDRLLIPPVDDHDAAGFLPESRMTIEHELDLAGAVTVEMWAQSSFVNTKLFDSSGRVYLAWNSDGSLECGINGGAGKNSIDGGELNGAWHHLACTIDANRNVKVFVDGDVEDCGKFDAAIDTGRTGTTKLSAGLTGSLDSVHVYRRALTPADICASAGRVGCRSSCPEEASGGPGGGPPGPGN